MFWGLIDAQSNSYKRGRSRVFERSRRESVDSTRRNSDPGDPNLIMEAIDSQEGRHCVTPGGTAFPPFHFPPAAFVAPTPMTYNNISTTSGAFSPPSTFTMPIPAPPSTFTMPIPARQPVSPVRKHASGGPFSTTSSAMTMKPTSTTGLPFQGQGDQAL